MPALVGLLLLTGACGGDDDDEDAGPTTVSSAATTTTVQRSPEERGARLVEQRGCTSCHTSDGRSSVGPTWKDLAGSQVTLTEGPAVTADDEYLRRSIVEPDAQVVKGFPKSVMPGGIAGNLTAGQIGDIVAYIKTL